MYVVTYFSGMENYKPDIFHSNETEAYRKWAYYILDEALGLGIISGEKFEDVCTKVDNSNDVTEIKTIVENLLKDEEGCNPIENGYTFISYPSGNTIEVTSIQIFKYTLRKIVTGREPKKRE